MGTGAVGASYGDLLVTSLVVLGGVCVAAFVVVRLAGRLLANGRRRGPQLLDVVARLPLEPRRSLYVVEVAGKTLLVGTSEMGLSVLSELDGDQVRGRLGERPSFGELVRAAWQGRRGWRTPYPSGRADAPSESAAAAARAGRAEPARRDEAAAIDARTPCTDRCDPRGREASAATRSQPLDEAPGP